MEGIGRYKTDDSDKSKKRNKPNVISKLFICWVCPVLFKGNKRDVEEDDLIVPNKPYDSDRLGEKIQRYWLDEYQRAIKESRKPSLGKALMRAFWLAYMPGAILLLINATARTVQPLLFSELLSYWSANPAQTITRRDAGFYAIGMLVLNMISAFSQHHNTLFVNRFSLKMKIACSSLIYRKVLRMSQLSINEVAAGKLVNLLSNDVARFDMAFMFLHYIWLVPLQLAVVMYFLYDAAGYAPFVGLFGVILFILPIQAVLTKLTGVIRRVVAQRTDKRIKLMGEIIKGIQVIKMYAWEKSFEQVVKVVRAFELAALRKSIFVRSVFLGFMMYAERSTLFITSLTIILSGTLLRADLIYPVKVFLGIVQINLTFILPLAIASLSELNVSLGRIQKVLIMDEREDLSLITNANKPLIPITFNGKQSTIGTNSIVVRKYSTMEKLPRPSIVGSRSPTVGEYTVELTNVSATWTKSDEMTLKNITMNIRKGKLCAIVGSVGSGKSSLLQVLLREMPISGGQLNVKGSMSYACQDSWLFPATVRENILFGLPYEVERYKEVCRACSLAPDFKQFPYGDLSLVGERGVSLSGGQRARINLARAVYREADIYLLDDPLSAVDANVGRQLFERCIQKYLSGRTRILVTHQVHFLKSADFIVVLKEGSIKNMGSYEDLKSEVEFSSLVSEVKETEEGKTEADNNRPKLEHTISKVSVRSNENPKEEKEQIMAAEERAKGNLKWEVIRHYLASVNSWLVVFLAVFAVLVTQFGATFSDYWLSYWTNQVDDYELSLPPGVMPDTSLDTKMGPLTTGQYLWIYGGAVLFIIIMTNVRIAGFVMMTMRASQNLHDVMFKNLIAAVMRFFDTNPSGRVLNRFSKDMGAMDEILPRSILESIQMYLFVASVLVLNALALPYTLIPTAILLVIFVFLLKWYLNAAQAVKRLESTTKSPVFSMINSTIAGLSTVRSSNSQFRLLRMFDDAQDINTSAFYTFLGGSSCFGLYMDLLCLIYLGIILAIFLLIDFEESVAVGSVGLAVSQSMALTMMLQMAARVTAELLAQMTSVERVLEYSVLPAEENMETAKILPPENWPSDGQMQFENVSLKYAEEDPPVLKNLTFTIKSGWKVGIVGRTGAGKSSLISALFRLANIQGSIKIDGVDTNDIPKKDLRSKISIIPQEPVLFSATLRYNLDPFFLYSDDEIWRALEQVELKEAVTSLDFNVSEGGTNFSVGQRQLVCLARAVLRSNKILVMDEATANVDPQTDALIQTTIRRQFASCTVLTIAHRLNTIMDSDRILVMDKGEVAEFDHPYILLSNPKSLLNFMVRETGTSMSVLLFETAKNKYFSENEEISKDK
nr:multidrug resistance-associated protein 4-like [Maniola hyperantus]